MTAAPEVVDHTGLVRSPESVERLVAAVLEAEGREGEVTVAFVSEEAIAELNRRYRGVDSPTDVLTFDYSGAERWPGERLPGEQGPGGGEVGRADGEGPRDFAGVAGEVVVSPEVVIRYAREEGREPSDQLGWTLVHGTLHLLGYDHETDRGEMREREQALLQRHERLIGTLTVESGS